MAETTINGEVYRTGKLNAMEQFHVVRRLLPIFSELGASITQINGSGYSEMNFLQALAGAVSKLSDEECEFVIAKCLTHCQRQQGPAWANVWNVAAKRLQFDDMDMQIMLNLTTIILQENLAGFFPALPFGFNPETFPPSVQ